MRDDHELQGDFRGTGRGGEGGDLVLMIAKVEKVEKVEKKKNFVAQRAFAHVKGNVMWVEGRGG